MPYKSLVIGCGNIGALYDLESDQILTHAKAFHNDERFSLTVFDIDQTISNKIARLYNCEVVDVIDREMLKQFDCISICTPTSTHNQYLKDGITAGVDLIICEKPVSDNSKELNDIREVYSANSTKILVNYIRRFQPAYQELKVELADFIGQKQVIAIDIRYSRGFLNNCSHALDILEYITNSEMILRNVRIDKKVYDVFKNDPTVSMQADWDGIPVNVSGLSNIKYNLFEIFIYFESHKVCITNNGQSIDIYEAQPINSPNPPLSISSKFAVRNGLRNYMENVINHGHNVLSSKNEEDNFLRSVKLIEQMLNYLKN
jgi:predicted dehydrogenase